MVSLLDVIPECPPAKDPDSSDTPALTEVEHGYVNDSSLTALLGIYINYTV